MSWLKRLWRGINRYSIGKNNSVRMSAEGIGPRQLEMLKLHEQWLRKQRDSTVESKDEK